MVLNPKDEKIAGFNSDMYIRATRRYNNKYGNNKHNINVFSFNQFMYKGRS